MCSGYRRTSTGKAAQRESSPERRAQARASKGLKRGPGTGPAATAIAALKSKGSGTGESELRTALSAVAKEHPDALFVYPDPILLAQRKQIAEFAVTNRLPTMFAFRAFVDAGGLMSYGASLREMGAAAGELVAKILDGKRPSELPVEQATRFELVINLKTARALGVTIPPSLLARADEVIE